jgi:hypothetical protein
MISPHESQTPLNLRDSPPCGGRRPEDATSYRVSGISWGVAYIMRHYFLFVNHFK